MNNPLVSVIIPTFNRRLDLKLAVDSVLNQTYPHFEIIIVDDGSTDGTQSDYLSTDPRIKYFYKDNEGLPSLSRNYGASFASGEYLAFLDSDDQWIPNKLKVQVEAMQAERNYIFSYTQGQTTGELIDRNISGFMFFKSGRVYYPLMFRNFIVTSSAMVIACKFREIGGFTRDNKQMISEDFDLWLRLSQLGKGLFIDTPLMLYNVGPQNISSNLNENFDCLLNVIKTNLRRYKSNLFARWLIFQVYWIRRARVTFPNKESFSQTVKFAEKEKAGILINGMFRILWKLKR